MVSVISVATPPSTPILMDNAFIWRMITLPDAEWSGLGHTRARMGLEMLRIRRAKDARTADARLNARRRPSHVKRVILRRVFDILGRPLPHEPCSGAMRAQIPPPPIVSDSAGRDNKRFQPLYFA
jgi:hypothetical protein